MNELKHNGEGYIDPTAYGIFAAFQLILLSFEADPVTVGLTFPPLRISPLLF